MKWKHGGRKEFESENMWEISFCLIDFQDFLNKLLLCRKDGGVWYAKQVTFLNYSLFKKKHFVIIGNFFEKEVTLLLKFYLK